MSADKAALFARLSPREKAAQLAAITRALQITAPAHVARACAALDVSPESAIAAAMWTNEQAPLIGYAERLTSSLTAIARGEPPVDLRPSFWREGLVRGALLPAGLRDRIWLSGTSAHVIFAEGVKHDAIKARQAAFYHEADPPSGTALVADTGPHVFMAVMDALHELYVEGRAVILVIRPEHAGAEEGLRHAFEPLLREGYLDLVVAEPARAAELASANDAPVIRARGAFAAPGHRVITDGLGPVPVFVVPWLYAADELAFMALSIASDAALGGGLDGAGARLLVLPKGFSQRDTLLTMIGAALAKAEAPLVGPSAGARVEALVSGGERRTFGHWTMVDDARVVDDGSLWLREAPGVPAIAVAEVGSDDPIRFLAAMTTFANEKVEGGLACRLLMHPFLIDEADTAEALDRALVELRYGVIGVNARPSLARSLPLLPWGAHPSAGEPGDVGFTHNAAMAGGVEKVTLIGPLRTMRRPLGFLGSNNAGKRGRAFADYAANPSWRTLKPLLGTTLAG